MQKSVWNAPSISVLIAVHWRITAKMEGFNNKIRWLIKQAYDFRDREYFKLKIYQLQEISSEKSIWVSVTNQRRGKMLSHFFKSFSVLFYIKKMFFSDLPSLRSGYPNIFLDKKKWYTQRDLTLRWRFVASLRLPIASLLNPFYGVAYLRMQNATAFFQIPQCTFLYKKNGFFRICLLCVQAIPIFFRQKKWYTQRDLNP